MDLVLSEEQELLRHSASRYLRDKATPARVRALFDSAEGWARADWIDLPKTLGWIGAGVPVDYGGLGLGVPELVVLQQELGRALYPSPFFVMAALVMPALLELASPEQCKAYLPAFISAERVASMAFTDGRGTPFPHGVRVSATGRRDKITLDGDAGFVLFGHAADLFLVVAREGHGLSLMMISKDAPGVEVIRLKSADPARPIAALRLRQVTISQDARIGAAGTAGDRLQRVMHRAAVIQAAEQVGGSERCIEMATTYAHTRVQFGRPIGSFQAIKHLLADDYMAQETAKSMLWYAACVADGQGGSLAEVAPVIKAYASETFIRCAADTIQVHGGMGYTWECDAHFYLKHARATANFLGDASWQREQLARPVRVTP